MSPTLHLPWAATFYCKKKMHMIWEKTAEKRFIILNLRRSDLVRGKEWSFHLIFWVLDRLRTFIKYAAATLKLGNHLRDITLWACDGRERITPGHRITVTFGLAHITSSRFAQVPVYWQVRKEERTTAWAGRRLPRAGFLPYPVRNTA